MGTIVISQNVTLDGIVEDPTGGEGFRHGGWFTEHLGPDREKWAEIEFAEARGASALLMGRRTDHHFGTRWTDAPGPWADRLRELPKYVVSTTVEKTVWTNGTVLNGDVVEEVEKLKADIDGEIVVYASRTLVHALMEHDLVDEIRLIVFPVVLGSGQRAFAETSDKTPLRLREVERVGETLSRVSFEVVRD